jgi:saccharopine dehydrogenase-like NADP-dependent oxidoreductase
MPKIVVLGGYGEMGSIIVRDLADSFGYGEIVVAGRNADKAAKFSESFHKSNISGFEADSGNKSQMERLLRGADVLINATNYYANVEVMQHALNGGVNYVDLGGLYHVTKLQLGLHERFKKKGLVAIIGCGSTPGITNVLAEYGAKKFDRIKSVDISFADKDFTKYNMPYVVPYSMQTVFDEFTSDAAVLKNSKVKFIKALSDEKYIDFPKPIGRVMCRSVIHSELASLPDSLHEKGIQECIFRGGWDDDFVAKTRFLIDAGFAGKKPVRVGGKDVVPRDLSVSLLNRFIPSDKVKINDTEILNVEITGRKGGKYRKLNVYCQAFTNKKNNIPAGSWDTGVPPSVAAQEIISGSVNKKGVLSPEKCITPQIFFKGLKRRKIIVFTKMK